MAILRRPLTCFFTSIRARISSSASRTIIFFIFIPHPTFPIPSTFSTDTAPTWKTCPLLASTNLPKDFSTFNQKPSFPAKASFSDRTLDTIYG